MAQELNCQDKNDDDPYFLILHQEFLYGNVFNPKTKLFGAYL